MKEMIFFGRDINGALADAPTAAQRLARSNQEIATILPDTDDQEAFKAHCDRMGISLDLTAHLNLSGMIREWQRTRLK